FWLTYSLPQSIEVCVCCLRAARDKLPRGLYSIRVALQSTLGGSSLHLRSSKEQTWSASTEPVEHRGRFYDNDLHINQSLSFFLIIYFKSDVLLGHHDAFCSLKFKTPLIRGEPSPQLDQFKKIEAIISSDLDHWLCNLYFQVIRWIKIILCLNKKKKKEKKTIVLSPLKSTKEKPVLRLMEKGIVLFHPIRTSPTTPRSRPPRLSDRARLALRMLPSELGLPLSWQQQQPHRRWHDSVQQLGLIILLLALMWFVRLYLHYCSQWLYLQAIAVPVNKFHFHAHTVDLIYQSSLLHTREELAMVVVGPLTLNAVTFLLVLIRWGCQLIFGSLPSFTSNFIMAQGVWTVLDPLAVFAVDAVLGHLAYSPDTPVGDAAKLYWHFYRADGSGAAGVIITLFLYAVHVLLSITILTIYLLRFHNDGRMLDVYQRLTAKEGVYFLPEDLELSNQELSYIVKKAEQWRGFNGERRKVAVYDSIWTAEDFLSSPSAPGDEPHTEDGLPPESETSTHVVIQTLYLSGLKQRYRHFLRQPDGTIIEVRLKKSTNITIIEEQKKKNNTCKSQAAPWIRNFTSFGMNY
uniref:Uncharacterized protein n=1 Tax=Xiphophorus couchianus TaxID=32473 RepID=A0A3B5LB05_9TELE